MTRWEEKTPKGDTTMTAKKNDVVVVRECGEEKVAKVTGTKVDMGQTWVRVRIENENRTVWVKESAIVAVK